MKKLILSLFLMVTAFLGVNQLNINLYAFDFNIGNTSDEFIYDENGYYVLDNVPNSNGNMLVSDVISVYGEDFIFNLDFSPAHPFYLIRIETNPGQYMSYSLADNNINLKFEYNGDSLSIYGGQNMIISESSGNPLTGNLFISSGTFRIQAIKAYTLVEDDVYKYITVDDNRNLNYTLLSDFGYEVIDFEQPENTNTIYIFDVPSGGLLFTAPVITDAYITYDSTTSEVWTRYGTEQIGFSYDGEGSSGTINIAFDYVEEPAAATLYPAGERVYVHLPSTNPINHYVTVYNATDDFIVNDRFTIETPEGWTGFYIEDITNEAGIIFSVTDTSVTSFYGEVGTQYLDYIASTGDASNPDPYTSPDLYNLGDLLIYFEIETPEPAAATLYPAGDRVYVHFGTATNATNHITSNNQTALTNAGFVANSDIFLGDKPNNAIDFIVVDADTSEVLPNMFNPGDMNTMTAYFSGLYNQLEFFSNYDDDSHMIETIGVSNIIVYFVLDTVEPVISGESLLVNIDAPLTEAEIRSQLTAIDDIDGDITDQINLVGGDYESTRVSGQLLIDVQYSLIYEVEDSSGNVTQATIYVVAKDITKPDFTIEDTTIDISYTEEFDEVDFISYLGAYDNQDDVTLPVVEVVSSDYSFDQAFPASYQVVYKATDASGNFREITINILTYDDVSPVSYGDTAFTVPFASNTALSILLENTGANDFIEGEITPQVLSDTYTGYTTPGIKQVTLRYQDASGNYVDQVITINVVDGIPPVLYVTNNFLIATDTINTLTLEQIIDIINLSEEVVSYSVVVNNYYGNEGQIGTYLVTLEITDSDNNTSMYTTSIFVTNSEVSEWVVTFNTNGGSLVESVTVSDLGQVIIEAPSKTGFRFVGWYKDEALTQPFSLITDRIIADTTLYAKWVPMESSGSVIIDNLNSFTAADYMIMLAALLGVLYIGYLIRKKRG